MNTLKSLSIVFVTFLLFNTLCFSQKEASIWEFGFRGNINFIGNTITSTGNNSMDTNEGSASICDSNGNLLFYTDGKYLYNGSHLLLTDTLLGSFTSTQSALIVPVPGNQSRYYIFTASPQAGSNNYYPYAGIAYSMIDMGIGSGTMIFQNQHLVTPACEKLTAVRHCNYYDYWVIVHEWNTDAFYAYLVTSSGVMPPVISHIGSIHYEGWVTDNSEAIGYLKASPDGHRLACGIGPYINKLEIFNFDNQSGILSNPISISLGKPYGVCFSEDNSKLYVSSLDSVSIFQYDMNAPTPAAFISSRTTIAHSTSQFFDALQMGPDKKIYVANFRFIDFESDHLHCINSPNLAGSACNFQLDAVKLANYSSSKLGLPNFIDAIFERQPKLDSVIESCNFPLTLDQLTRNKKYHWSTGDTTASISVNAPGIYWVTVDMSECTSISDTTIIIDRRDANIEVKSINVFSPNNDGINDLFIFDSLPVSNIHLTVFNRWGEKVFETRDSGNGWNGTSENKDCPAGIYYWVLDMELKSFCTEDTENKKGFVNLLR